MELTIRRYQQADHRIVCELHNKALKAANAHIGSGKWDDDLNDLEGVNLDPGGEFLVATSTIRLLQWAPSEKCQVPKLKSSVCELNQNSKEEGMAKLSLASWNNGHAS